MKVNYAHLCDYALIANNKLSAIGIFDQIRPQRLPWAHPVMYLAFEIGLEPAELGVAADMKIVVRDEDGRKVINVDGKIQTGGSAKIGEKPTAKQVLGINNLVFQRAGPHEVNIWIGSDLKHTLPFTVMPPPRSSDATSAEDG